ncbi:hypothetical protein D920_02554 [Enterococcus faecalis 13-SD-W-01]|nr:hypothetical protein D920_02554 [Enterococcus faecalis 13-SD-W-01]
MIFYTIDKQLFSGASFIYYNRKKAKETNVLYWFLLPSPIDILSEIVLLCYFQSRIQQFR